MARAAAGDDRDPTASRPLAHSSRVVAPLRAVAVDGRDEDLAGAERLGTGRERPRRRSRSRASHPAVNASSVPVRAPRRASIDATTHCAPNSAAASRSGVGLDDGAVLRTTLSAPARMMPLHVVDHRMPPPTESGTWHASQWRPASAPRGPTRGRAVDVQQHDFVDAPAVEVFDRDLWPADRQDSAGSQCSARRCRPGPARRPTIRAFSIGRRASTSAEKFRAGRAARSAGSSRGGTARRGCCRAAPRRRSGRRSRCSRRHHLARHRRW